MRSLWAALLLASLHAAHGSVFHEDFEHGLSPEWKKVEFTGETKHSVRTEAGDSFLEAHADAAASGLAMKLKPVPAGNLVLSWRWKIDRIPPGGSDTEIKKFDHTARLFVAFKTFLGPPRTINYVWANEAKPGSTFHHPNSGRSRFIVLESGNEKAGQWMLEKREIAADWKRLFGDDEPPAVVGLGFMTDSDGTGASVTGSYDDLDLASKAAGSENR